MLVCLLFGGFFWGGVSVATSGPGPPESALKLAF